MTPLTQIIDTYSILRPISPGRRYNLAYSVGLFSRWLGRQANTNDLLDTTVSGWIQSVESDYAKASVRHHRATLKTLWIFAHRRGLAGPVGEIRPAPLPEPDPQVWTLTELHRLLAECHRLDCGDYFHALLLFAYESGLRKSDCWTIAREQIRPDGLVSLRQHKTARVHVCRVRPETASEVLRLDGQTPLAWPRAPVTFYRRFRRLRKLAGVASGALQQLRRTGATEVARADGEAAASAWLGHVSGQMWRCYVSQSAIARPWLPPRVA